MHQKDAIIVFVATAAIFAADLVAPFTFWLFYLLPLLVASRSFSGKELALLLALFGLLLALGLVIPEGSFPAPYVVNRLSAFICLIFVACFLMKHKRTNEELERSRAELQKSKNELELRIDERTKELSETICAIEREVRERIQTQEILAKQSVELKRAYEDLTRMSHHLAHDLRGPLRGITGFAQLLLKRYGDGLNEQGRHYLQRIGASASNIASVIDGLGLLAEVGNCPVRRKKFDLSQMVEDIIQRLLREDRERWRVTVQPVILAHADRRLIGIAMEQLISNAVKFASIADAPEIEFFSEIRDGKRIYILRDNGVGFDERFVHKLFTPFQRLHLEDEYPGVGIGLAVVKAVVINHGGTISATGSLGKGAVFSFTLGEED